jgi:hypothetical protein
MPEESTTPDLEEKVRRAIEADPRDLEAGLAFFAPDAVWDTSPLGMRVFERRETIRGMFEIGGRHSRRTTAPWRSFATWATA